MGIFEDIRASTRAVSRQASQVQIDADRAGALAEQLAGSFEELAALDPAHHALATAKDTLAFVITMDAINFGSGWFPVLEKRPGLSGYLTLASALREYFASRGCWSAPEMMDLEAATLAEILGQGPRRHEPEVMELMELYAESLRFLGDWLQEKFDGSFEALVEEARGSAEALAGLLTEMPFYRDVGNHRGIEVGFYKRAQITASDLAGAFEGQGWGRFTDLDSATIFADNLVPHVLRCEGVLRYEPGLAEKIQTGQLLVAGSEEEVEIRACAVAAVEMMVEGLRATGRRASAREFDFVLWTRGQDPRIKAHPRHRCRCVYY